MNMTDISSLKHTDKRTNIPTQELRGFVADDEKSPKAKLYPRDPSLDPQLVWKGKDEQDQEDLVVPVVPIYIQEKIHPQALVEALRKEARKETAPMADLFSDFNNIKFEDLVDFYRHEQNWSNRMILGDSLMVMTSLAEKEGLKGKVQCIYMDPPYGIKFGSNWQVSTRKREVKDGKAEDASRDPEVVKAFRDTWSLGINSYLTYLRDRLVVSHELLSDSGSIFVQIGDENVHLVRCVLDEVFGSENFCGIITLVKTAGSTSDILPGVCDFIVWYAKSKENMKYRQIFSEKNSDDSGAGEYKRLLFSDGSSRPMTKAELADPSLIPKDAARYRPTQTTSQKPPGSDPLEFEGRVFRPGPAQYWKTSINGLKRLGKAGRLIARGQSVSYLRRLDDFPVAPINNLWTDARWGFDASDKRYVVETNAKIVARCILMVTDTGDLVLDPTCGSGTTAFAAEQWGRRWITIDTSRVALALARTRLMAARFPYYLLADSQEGLKKEAEVTGRVPPEQPTSNDIKKGFVFRRVPHITLKSIANNPEIDAIHEKWEAVLEPIRQDLNRAVGKTWEEWEIPREGTDEWSDAAKELLTKWWDTRRGRQAEIDTAIGRNADTEVLFDQAYDDPKKVRVSSPFTVESLSPHRVLSTDEEAPAAEKQESTDFITTILDHLRKAGVQNNRKAERLKFDRLEPFAGTNLQAEGEYTDANGTIVRVAVALGPEHGTVGPELVQAASIEATKGRGFDMLLVCGFAFDPHVSEEAKNYGRLVVLPVKMNPDLAMGDELLKKTGSGNLFMVFGEPDIGPLDKQGRVQPRADGKIVLEIRGVDVYDPTTGQIRSRSTDDIACWFIDTSYDDKSFFVRHAYFAGADEPYDRLKKALRAEIDEAAWSSLYSTTSRPFDRPATGKIAVKVINHYGDEVLRIYEVAK